MRADFMGQALLFRPFADILQESSQMIGPMNRQEMKEVVERPLSGTLVTFEPAGIANSAAVYKYEYRLKS